MAATVTTDQVWKELERQIFGVLGMTTARHRARTVGIVYVIRERKLYVGTDADAWKTRHIVANPYVSMTVPIAKRIPFVPWIRIPAATITFNGVAKVLPVAEANPAAVERLFHGLENLREPDKIRVIEIEPAGSFLTYGVGVPLLTMRDTEAARGRAPV